MIMFWSPFSTTGTMNRTESNNTCRSILTSYYIIRKWLFCNEYYKTPRVVISFLFKKLNILRIVELLNYEISFSEKGGCGTTNSNALLLGNISNVPILLFLVS